MTRILAIEDDAITAKEIVTELSQPGTAQLIQTVRGSGYVIAEPV